MVLTSFGETIAGILITALLGALGWLIQSQISTNKTLSKAIADAVMEFKVAVETINQRDDKQKTLCDVYRNQMSERCRWMDSEIRELKEKIEKSHSE